MKEEFPDTLLLFVTPPSAGELKKRLVGRGTETMDVIEVQNETVHVRKRREWIITITLSLMTT